MKGGEYYEPEYIGSWQLSALSIDAMALRSKTQANRDDMLRLAKILSRKAQVELQLRTLGVPFTPAESESMTTDEADCPF